MRSAVLLLVIAPAVAAQTSDFAGTWVFRVAGQPVFKLILGVSGGRIAGSLIRPKGLSIDQDGDVNAIGPELQTLAVRRARLNRDSLEMTIDGDRFLMKKDGADGATLELPGMRPWRVERVPDGAAIVLATALPGPEYSAEIRGLRERLSAMVKEDQDARLAFDTARMERADAANRTEVLAIFDRYGWVTNSLAGKDAARNYWLLVQHQTAEIQQRMLPALESAAKKGAASMTDYAYLYDRVQVGLGKPQHWGTQAKCVKGKPVLSPVDDPDGLDARRRELFMLPEQAYLRLDYMVKMCKGRSK